MKILFLTEFFPKKDEVITGGVEARTYYLSRELEKLGHQVTVISANNAGPNRGYTKGGDLLQRLIFFWSLIWRGLRTDFDIVDGNNTATYLAVFVLSKLKRKTGIYWVPDALGFRRWVKAIGIIPGVINTINEWLSLRLPVDKIIALSETTQGIIEQNFSVPKERIVVIYPGVTTISPHHSQKTFTVISVNRLAKYKRNDLVIKALPKDVIYKVVGTGEEEGRLKRISHGKRVIFLGNFPHSRVLNEYQKADLFCLASEIEGFGIATLEAMAASLPFINSNIPVHREILAKSHAGLLFENDLKEKIGVLRADKNLYQELSHNALVFAKKHTWAKMAKKYEDLLSH